MSGLMLGLLLSRPAGSLIAGALGWRAVYAASAIAVAILMMLLARSLPAYRPPSPVRYFESLASLLPLLMREPVLRRRATSQALLMFSFNCFWIAVAWRLRASISSGSRGIALFALAGAGGVLIAPAAGRAGDRGLTRAATLWAHLAVIAGLALAALTALDSSSLPVGVSLVALVATAVLLSMGGVADQALGRHAVNMIGLKLGTCEWTVHGQFLRRGRARRGTRRPSLVHRRMGGRVCDCRHTCRSRLRTPID